MASLKSNEVLHYEKNKENKNCKRKITISFILLFSDKVRNHGCHLCPKRFLKVQHLNDHIGRHFGAKPHQCNLCDKKYTSLFSLKSHKVGFESDFYHH